MKIPSLQQILYRLVGTATDEAQSTPVDTSQPTRFPVVVRPETRVFLQAQATALGGSIAGLAGALLDGVAMAQVAAPEYAAQTVIGRFHLLLQEHGLSIPAAAEVLQPFGLVAADFSDSSKLLDKLNVKALEGIAKHFRVNYGWLAGKTALPFQHNHHYWYKSQLCAAQTLLEAIKHGRKARLIILRVEGFDYESATVKDDDQYGNQKESNFRPILAVEHQIGEHEMYTTYEAWETGRWSYWRCREHIKMVIYFATEIGKSSSHRLSVRGYSWTRADFDKIEGGGQLLTTLFKSRSHGLWDPDDFVEPTSMVAKDKAEWLSIRDGEEYSGLLANFTKLLERHNAY